jgi:hypothetical protein
LAAAKRPRRFACLGEKSLEGGQFAQGFCRVTRGIKAAPVGGWRLDVVMVIEVVLEMFFAWHLYWF